MFTNTEQVPRSLSCPHGTPGAGPSGACQTLIDYDHLAKYTMGDQDLEREILDLFADQLPGLVQQLAAAIDNDDTAIWHQAAHTIKGSALAVGANQLALAARAAETAEATQFPDCLTAISEAVAQVSLEIRQMRSS